jgi:poly(A) polymerase
MKPEVYPRGQHPITQEMLDPDALKIIERLTRYDFCARLVGGGVRDLLLGKSPKDFDIATDATPKHIKKLFRNSRIIGRRFKLAHIFFSTQKIIEVATFRDSANDDSEATQQLGADNVFGTEQTDALRRDLTINALFFDAVNESIIDYVGGMRDLREGIVRVIGDPDIRFHEDPVRLLRVVRHAARSNFTIETKCYESLERNRGLLEAASPVRLYEELKKDIGSGHILPILQLLERTRLLSVLVPEIVRHKLLSIPPFLESISRIDELTKAGTPLSPTIFFSLIALFSLDPLYTRQITDIFPAKEAIEEHIQALFQGLQVPRRERERIVHVLELWWLAAEHDEKGPMKVRTIQTPYLSEVTDMVKILPLREGDRKVLTLMTETARRHDGRSSAHRHHIPYRRKKSGRSRNQQHE